MMLKDKIIIVTGGSGLLGRAILAEIKQKGGIGVNVDIGITDDEKNNTFYADTTSETSVEQLIEKLDKHYGKIDGWVNNAYPRTKDWGAKPEEVPYESWRQNIDMQLNGYYLCCNKILAYMSKFRQGSIVNMSSIYGVVGPDFTVYDGTNMGMPIAYSAIKGGLVNLTRYFASYYGKYNIRINCVSPGGVFDNQNPIFVENYNKKVPMGRMALPEDIAPSVAFLLSDDARYITGHNLVVDGGWTSI